MTPIGRNTSLLIGSGIGDFAGGLKCEVKSPPTSIVVEARIKHSPYSRFVSDTSELVLGDANLDFGLIAHLDRSFTRLFIDLSPGIIFRSGGYSMATRLSGGVGWKSKPLLIHGFIDSILSFEEALLFDSSAAQHDALGTGGSYAKLSGSPSGISAGVQLGLDISTRYEIIGELSHALWGKRYPNYIRFGLFLTMDFDLYAPENKLRLREVPFQSEGAPNTP